MTPKLQILPAEVRLQRAERVNDLLPADKAKLINLIKREIAGKLEGVHEDIPSEVYHHPLCPGFNHSAINEAAKSATHFLLSSKWVSPAMELGTLFHTLILEPHLFERDGVSAENMAKLERMVKSIRSHKSYDILFNPLLERKIEFTVFAKCPITGLIRKCRPDLGIMKRAIVDLKTTSADGSDEFGQRADTYHYESQSSFYKDTCELVDLHFPENYHWAVRSEGDHDVIVHSYDNTFLDAGRTRYMQGLENIANLIESNKNYLGNNEVFRITKG